MLLAATGLGVLPMQRYRLQRELHDNLRADLADSVGQLRDRSLQARSAVRDDLNTLERRLFRGNLLLLNEQGDWIPMGKELTEWSLLPPTKVGLSQ